MTNDKLPERSTLRARLTRLSKWDRATALLLLPWLAVVIVNLGGFWWWEAPLRTWIALGVSVPILLAIAFSLTVVAANTPSRYIISRDSILWRWLAGIGRGLRASTSLAIGAFLGGLVGSGITASASLDDLREPLRWMLLVVTIAAAVAIVWWTAIAAIDIGRLSRAERVDAVRRAFPRTRGRRRGFPQFLASLADPSTVVLWGLVALLLIAHCSTWALSTLGTS